jgi:hypothetical protein
MHNSIFIRDILKARNRDPLILSRRNPHRHVTWDRQAKAGSGDFTMAGEWRVVVETDPMVAALLTSDVELFLRIFDIRVTREAATCLCFRLVPDLPERDCRLVLAPTGIFIEAGGISGLWAGQAWLEFEMARRRGPFLPKGTMERRAAWPVQISQGPWGGNYSVPDFSPEYLSDDSFRLYAHYGVNSMMIYGDLLCYVKSEIFPELNYPEFEQSLATLKDAAKRAARYGVRFTWVVVGPKLRPDHPLFQRLPDVRGSGLRTPEGAYVHCLCSSHEKTRQFYREVFSHLFREVPELEGLILIVGGESMYHCRMWTHEPPAAVRCPRCWARPEEDVISELVGTLQDAIRSAYEDAQRKFDEKKLAAFDLDFRKKVYEASELHLKNAEAMLNISEAAAKLPVAYDAAKGALTVGLEGYGVRMIKLK